MRVYFEEQQTVVLSMLVVPAIDVDRRVHGSHTQVGSSQSHGVQLGGTCVVPRCSHVRPKLFTWVLPFSLNLV